MYCQIGHHRQGHFFILHILFFFILSLLLLLCLSLHLRLIVLQGPHLLWPNVSIILSKGSPHLKAFIFLVSSSTPKNILSYYNDRCFILLLHRHNQNINVILIVNIYLINYIKLKVSLIIDFLILFLLLNQDIIVSLCCWLWLVTFCQ